MAQLGYERSGKKCKEKFENVYKYHKRTKDGRAAKANGKSYCFYEELKALETSPCPISTLPPPPPPPQATTTVIPAAISMATGGRTIPHVGTVSSAPYEVTPVSRFSPFLSAIFPNSMNPEPAQRNYNSTTIESPHPPSSLLSDYSSSSSMSNSSDKDMDMGRRRKRKMKSFLEWLMNDVMRKQEESQKKFLDTLEKLERDRMVREEAWRKQEIARMNREFDHLAQERSMAADKDRAMMALLQKMSGQKSQSSTNNDATLQVPQNPTIKDDINVGENLMTPSPSRWPKAEVEALISLRTNLDIKYLDNIPKGPLWEEISVEMNKLGFHRSSKRCKEKWENINKYYKKMKENCTSSSKKRPEDSKTCPYFLQLDALYTSIPKTPPIEKPGSPENPMMVRPVQQCPMPHGQEPTMEEEELTLDDDQGRQEGAYV